MPQYSNPDPDPSPDSDPDPDPTQSLLRTTLYPCGAADLPPPHSLHALRTRPCSQMPLPPHSLHTLCCRPCSQPAARGCRRRILCKPRCRTCSQMLLLPHSLQSLRRLLRSQMLLRAHSLHWLRLRPCSQHRCRRRTPCTRCVASRDDNGRCLCHRSPCRGSAAARACSATSNSSDWRRRRPRARRGPCSTTTTPKIRRTRR